MRLDKILIFFACAIAIILMIFVFASQKNDSLEDHPERNQRTLSQNLEQEDSSEESAQAENNLVETGTPSSGESSDGGGSSAGGGGGDSSSSSQTSSQNCQQTEVSYALKKFQKSEICNEYLGEVCINKEVTCSVEAHNLDYVITGVFEIEFSFLNSQSEVLAVQTSSESIEPRGSKIISSTSEFNEPNANEQITCDFRTMGVPSKEVCQ